MHLRGVGRQMDARGFDTQAIRLRLRKLVEVEGALGGSVPW
jgi:hypothetical protein